MPIIESLQLPQSQKEYEKIINKHNDGLHILFFYSDHCQNCKRLKPHIAMSIEELKNSEIKQDKKEVIFFQLHFAQFPDLVRELQIMGVPTMVFRYNGKTLFRFSGLTDYIHIVKKVKALINEL